jgi:hypothetical protein
MTSTVSYVNDTARSASHKVNMSIIDNDHTIDHYSIQSQIIETTCGII